MIVPFRRAIKRGSRGRDVTAVKRALSKAGYIKWGSFTRVFGLFAVRSLRKFQQQHHLHVDGIVGPNTLKRLAPYFDTYGYLLYVGHTPSDNREEEIRNKIVAYVLWGYNNRGRVHYAEYRPMDYLNALRHLPIWDDCSEFATKAYKYASAPDPNGRNFNGLGYTGDELRHGRKVTIAQARPGDLVHYGPNKHVAVYIGHNKVISHGSEGGPYLLPYNYRSDFAEIRSYL